MAAGILGREVGHWLLHTVRNIKLDERETKRTFEPRDKLNMRRFILLVRRVVRRVGRGCSGKSGEIWVQITWSVVETCTSRAVYQPERRDSPINNATTAAWVVVAPDAW